MSFEMRPSRVATKQGRSVEILSPLHKELIIKPTGPVQLCRQSMSANGQPLKDSDIGQRGVMPAFIKTSVRQDVEDINSYSLAKRDKMNSQVMNRGNVLNWKSRQKVGTQFSLHNYHPQGLSLHTSEKQFQMGFHYLHKRTTPGTVSFTGRQMEIINLKTRPGVPQHSAPTRNALNHKHTRRLAVSALAQNAIIEEEESAEIDIPNLNSSNNMKKDVKSRAQSCYSSIFPTDIRKLPSAEQKLQANKRERLLTSIPMNSNFSLILREAVKPAKSYAKFSVSRTPSSKSVKLYRAPSLELTSANNAAGSYPTLVMPNLRMDNEESSFTHYVRLNKASARRLGTSSDISLRYW